MASAAARAAAWRSSNSCVCRSAAVASAAAAAASQGAVGLGTRGLTRGVDRALDDVSSTSTLCIDSPGEIPDDYWRAYSDFEVALKQTVQNASTQPYRRRRRVMQPRDALLRLQHRRAPRRHLILRRRAPRRRLLRVLSTTLRRH